MTYICISNHLSLQSRIIVKKRLIFISLLVLSRAVMLSSQSKQEFQDDTLSAGSFRDLRDGSTYKYIRIGDQVWMSQNINYLTFKGSDCYKKDPDNCDKYGRLYNLDAAMIACPDGWHLPSDEEWKTLERYLEMPEREVRKQGLRGDTEGRDLKAGGKTGFDALLAGKIFGNLMADQKLGKETYFWTSKQNKYSNKSYIRMLAKKSDRIYRSIDPGEYKYSVRCIKDENSE